MAAVGACESCKWWMSFKRACLLGRLPDKCTTQNARRGDDELVDRMVGMAPKDFQKLRRQWREQSEEREVSFHKSDEWD